MFPHAKDVGCRSEKALDNGPRESNSRRQTKKMAAKGTPGLRKARLEWGWRGAWKLQLREILFHCATRCPSSESSPRSPRKRTKTTSRASMVDAPIKKNCNTTGTLCKEVSSLEYAGQFRTLENHMGGTNRSLAASVRGTSTEPLRTPRRLGIKPSTSFSPTSAVSSVNQTPSSRLISTAGTRFSDPAVGYAARMQQVAWEGIWGTVLSFDIHNVSINANHTTLRPFGWASRPRVRAGIHRGTTDIIRSTLRNFTTTPLGKDQLGMWTQRRTAPRRSNYSDSVWLWSYLLLPRAAEVSVQVELLREFDGINCILTTCLHIRCARWSVDSLAKLIDRLQGFLESNMDSHPYSSYLFVFSKLVVPIVGPRQCSILSMVPAKDHIKHAARLYNINRKVTFSNPQVPYYDSDSRVSHHGKTSTSTARPTIPYIYAALTPEELLDREPTHQTQGNRITRIEEVGKECQTLFPPRESSADWEDTLDDANVIKAIYPAVGGRQGHDLPHIIHFGCSRFLRTILGKLPLGPIAAFRLLFRGLELPGVTPHVLADVAAESQSTRRGQSRKKKKRRGYTSGTVRARYFCDALERAGEACSEEAQFRPTVRLVTASDSARPWRHIKSGWNLGPLGDTKANQTTRGFGSFLEIIGDKIF
ncbi:hypothetical protein B0H16DRAFT_1448211 [Mycena metata]|uniref:Uncharacterized protein n=1 Tax=Mycena metata TaxID=1033252 RepID=A0AAD7K7E5_9AGAR|nr:hypothetical protein B0H16DRAFT_1448211 [Mycena metata]